MTKLFAHACIFVLLIFGFAHTQDSRQITINGEQISAADLWALESYYQITIPDGRYWYDPISGLVGPENGPSVGQILPGLALGILSSSASGSGTGTFINGRELHWQEMQDLQNLLGTVYPGYFWMDAQGNVSSIGGTYLFNLFDLIAQANTEPAYHRSIFGHELTGSVIGDGQTVGFIDGNLGITCGPDGGCTGW